jgi:hypothetical protein
MYLWKKIWQIYVQREWQDMWTTTYAEKYLDQSEKGYWKYKSIYISLTNVCTFLMLLDYKGKSLRIRIMWCVNTFVIFYTWMSRKFRLELV